MRASHLSWLLCLLLAWGLAACGGGGGDADSTDNDQEYEEEYDENGEREEDGEADDGDGGYDDGASPVTDAQIKLLAFNDLGMHCMDREYSVFSILPPYNVVNAQVIRQGGEPEKLGPEQVEVRYAAVTDPDGSTNSGSVQKTDFWQYADSLFGTELNPGEGLKGFYMPADHPVSPGAQAMTYSEAHGWFSAEGIPITPMDDNGRVNPYPLLRVSAHDRQTGEMLAHVDVVVPVSQETDCRDCHASGQGAADDPGVQWSTEADLEVQAKQNILRLHDQEHDTQLAQSTPVLCADCHYSPALDLNGQGPQGGQLNRPTLSRALHSAHAFLDKGERDVEQTCYQCHPGKETRCQRGAMREGGMQCFECHGGLEAVAGEHPLLAGGSLDGSRDHQSRHPWTDLPRCQSCHTGDALNHATGEDLIMHEDGIRLRQAYRRGDASASPLLAANQRFAENPNTLFRLSKGHGGVACEGCHGATHAIWPNADAAANDNIAARQLQGHAGTVIECETCHADGLPLTTRGPHGMHNVGDPRWTDEGHEEFFERDPDGCRACHGRDLRGTSLSRMATTRVFNTEYGSVTLREDQAVGCDHCHGIPR